MHAWFLVPEGWYAKEEAQKQTVGVFIAREPISTPGGFKTGFTANAILGFRDQQHVDPSAGALEYITRQIELPSTKRSWGFDRGNAGSRIQGYGVFLRYQSERSGRDFIGRTFALGNDQTGTLYLTSFESPADQWDEDMKIGEVIMNLMVLDPDF